jgi:hypothetical protein
MRIIRLRRRSLQVLVLLAPLFGAAPALACSCVFPTVEQAKQDAVALFEGRVTSIVDAPAAGADVDSEYSVTLHVARSWRGLEKQARVTLRTAKSGATCGYAFEVGTSYLVYAGGAPGKLEVNSCSRTRRLREASEDLAALGSANTPATGAAKQGSAPAKSRSGGCASGAANTSAASLIWLGMPGLCLSVRQRRTR